MPIKKKNKGKKQTPVTLVGSILTQFTLQMQYRPRSLNFLTSLINGGSSYQIIQRWSFNLPLPSHLHRPF